MLFSLPLFLQGALGYTALGAGCGAGVARRGLVHRRADHPVLRPARGTLRRAVGMALEVVGITGLGLAVTAHRERVGPGALAARSTA